MKLIVVALVALLCFGAVNGENSLQEIINNQHQMLKTAGGRNLQAENPIDTAPCNDDTELVTEYVECVGEKFEIYINATVDLSAQIIEAGSDNAAIMDAYGEYCDAFGAFYVDYGRCLFLLKDCATGLDEFGAYCEESISFDEVDDSALPDECKSLEGWCADAQYSALNNAQTSSVTPMALVASVVALFVAARS